MPDGILFFTSLNLRLSGLIMVSKRNFLAIIASTFALSILPAGAAETKKVDLLLVGGGIMSASLGIWMNDLDPNISMEMIERLDGVAKESSFGWHNAGTGHAALAELNYTPQDKDGKVDISKAIEINEDFQISRQFWAWQVKKDVLKNPKTFINHTPHMSFVWGEKNISFLKARFAALQGNPLFAGMQYSEDHEQIKKWAPLMMIDRDPTQHIAATWSPLGTDMNFGEITRQFVGYLQKKPNFSLKVNSEVREIARNKDGSWRVTYSDLKNGVSTSVDAKKLFIGAGGGTLRLLQESGIPEANEYAGFPVGGSFLVTENPEITKQHLAKAYGKAPTGSPPMAVPHLDTRMLDGKRVILFGPFATFSTKFLKQGSYLDLLGTTTIHNLWPMTKVGIDQYPLMEYLAGQVMLSDDDRLNALREYYPNAKKEDWKLWQAGQRVQIIKRDEEKGGVLKLGTEIVTSKDASIAGLLGASPGASTAAPIMLNVVHKLFNDEVQTPKWQAKIRQIVPSYGTKLNASMAATHEVLTYTSKVLELPAPPTIENQKSIKTSTPIDIANQPVRKLNASTDMAL